VKTRYRAAKYEHIPAERYTDCVTFISTAYKRLTGADLQCLPRVRCSWASYERSPPSESCGWPADRRGTPVGCAVTTGICRPPEGAGARPGAVTRNGRQFGAGPASDHYRAPASDGHRAPHAPSAFLVDDAALATVITRLGNEPALIGHVSFFLDTLSKELSTADTMESDESGRGS
jgi:hypothetical protein